MPGGVMLPEFYNELGAMHGTIMVFLGVVPLAVGGFGNFVLPLQIGAPGHGLPAHQHGELLELLRGRLRDARRASSSRAARPSRAGPPTRRSPTSPAPGQTFWLIGMVFLITSSLLGSINFIVTTIQLRAPGLTLLAAAVLRLGAVRDVLPAAARVPAARGARRSCS